MRRYRDATGRIVSLADFEEIAWFNVLCVDAAMDGLGIIYEGWFPDAILIDQGGHVSKYQDDATIRETRALPILAGRENDIWHEISIEHIEDEPPIF